MEDYINQLCTLWSNYGSVKYIKLKDLGRNAYWKLSLSLWRIFFNYHIKQKSTIINMHDQEKYNQ